MNSKPTPFHHEANELFDRHSDGGRKVRHRGALQSGHERTDGGFGSQRGRENDRGGDKEALWHGTHALHWVSALAVIAVLQRATMHWPWIRSRALGLTMGLPLPLPLPLARILAAHAHTHEYIHHIHLRVGLDGDVVGRDAAQKGGEADAAGLLLGCVEGISGDV